MAINPLRMRLPFVLCLLLSACKGTDSTERGQHASKSSVAQPPVMVDRGRNCPEDWVMESHGRCHQTAWKLADSLIGQMIVFVDPFVGSRDSAYARLGPPLGRTIFPPDSMSLDSVVVWHY